MSRVSIAKARTIFSWATVLAGVLAFGAGHSEAQDARLMARVQPAAAVSAAGLTVTFAPKVADGMRLTVSGPLGVYSSREFAPGEAPTFVLIGDRGALPDGRYKYELRTQPQVDQRLLQIAEETDDERLLGELEREEQARVIVQAGQFTVVGGSIALPRLEIETEESPAASAEHAHGADTSAHE